MDHSLALALERVTILILKLKLTRRMACYLAILRAIRGYEFNSYQPSLLRPQSLFGPSCRGPLIAEALVIAVLGPLPEFDRVWHDSPHCPLSRDKVAIDFGRRHSLL